ncbi:MAG: D-glycero-beta-D-manno-heptose 1-phosphate adenylyltransferase [Candidatus Latescibacterota bacterium]|nr:MAG: D-glycero-beta-D-manno-heptose 1-phosphate adenylyltransferase [Candidatus Latescibacterota bacterium]RKY72524.1 MAG: D-glycero-beta-D-manno-heptose 1-phosphate adenylyltransferase [Candidatus Latescibacterota bacterium]
MGKVVELRKLVKIREDLRKKGLKVVFTNGCFDILHRGHIEYLKEAKQLGDVLIVGLNTDQSVRRVKGNRRPINCQEDRAAVLAALEAVDYVCPFPEETPAHIIETLVPDILVKGADWKLDEIVGRDTVRRAGGKVVRIEQIPGVSTRGIIQKIIERYCEQK